MTFRSAGKLAFLATSFSLMLPLLMSTSLICRAQKKAKLEKSYREWLERDVTYIITKDERDEFCASPRTKPATNLFRTLGSAQL